MSLALVYSRAQTGITAPLITVETHISPGLPRFTIVGLAETSVKESKDRVRSALQNANFIFPAKRITVNLAPADLPKHGGRYDLPIALSILAASQQLPLQCLDNYEFVGELSLSGKLRPIPGILTISLALQQQTHALIVPQANAETGALSGKIKIFGAEHLLDVCKHLLQQQTLPITKPPKLNTNNNHPDLTDVRGQIHAKRALEIAAAGKHSMLMIGPPGTGKTMLAQRLIGIMPSMDDDESLEVAAIHSINSPQFKLATWRQRPFRAPHHTASDVALVGGGNPPMPGEISLAHHGILFLDEFPEFSRHTLETLREPLESGNINIARAKHNINFPAQFQLIAAMNPCPCGHLNNPQQTCQCTTQQIQRYKARLSGPLLDRIDLHIKLPTLSTQEMLSYDNQTESSQQVSKRIAAAQLFQKQHNHYYNQQITSKQILENKILTTQQQHLLATAIEKLKLSPRAFYRTLKVARTIANLKQDHKIKTAYLTEALSYQRLPN